MIFPLVLAFILAAQMRKHRICEYTSEGRSVAFASLARRGVAYGVDSVILSGPMAAAGFLWLDRMQDMFTFMFSPRQFLTGMALIAAGGLWALIAMVIFSFMEGRTGKTPGKFLTGIRALGTDLQPCGFGRAFIRNLVKIADSMFGFLVGIVLAALTEKWQRLGDMAARTVVVRDTVFGPKDRTDATP